MCKPGSSDQLASALFRLLFLEDGLLIATVSPASLRGVICMKFGRKSRCSEFASLKWTPKSRPILALFKLCSTGLPTITKTIRRAGDRRSPSSRPFPWTTDAPQGRRESTIVFPFRAFQLFLPTTLHLAGTPLPAACCPSFGAASPGCRTGTSSRCPPAPPVLPHTPSSRSLRTSVTATTSR